MKLISSRGTVVPVLAWAVLGVGLCCNSSVVAQESRGPKGPPSREMRVATSQPTTSRMNLEHIIAEIDRKFGLLVRQSLDESKLDSNLVLVAELEQLTLSAKSIQPSLSKYPPADRMKMLGTYRKMMGNLLSAFTELESAIIDKDAGKIEEAINLINEIQRQGHEELKIKIENDHEDQ